MVIYYIQPHSLEFEYWRLVKIFPMPESDYSDPNARARGNHSTNADDTTGGSTPASGNNGGWEAIIDHIKGHRIDFILAITRVLTVLCTLSYLIGFPGPSNNRFKQALLMNAATSSLRLHQRMPPPPLNQLSRTYFMNLIKEDSFHYLIFPLMFFSGYPIALALLPCVLYALFNLARYAIEMLDKFGNQEQMKAKISELVTKYQQSLLHTVALSEVTLLPIVVIGLFTKSVAILVPIMYYRFLKLRYNSTRNAHLKLLVSQIKAVATAQAARFIRR